MIYSNTNVRRQNRLLNDQQAKELLKYGEYGVISLSDTDNNAYGIPISFVWNKINAIYLHCAPEGKKLNCIKHNNNVSFCVVGKTDVIPNQFTTEYQSIILQCTAHINLSKDERMNALSLILDKYSPNDRTVGMKYAEKSVHRTEIIRLDIHSFSGKCNSIT